MELISVIIPIYKSERYLDRCIASVINQTYDNLEIILVDDGSPDRCPEICDMWKQNDSRIKVIHQRNGGVSMARNTGINKAGGEFILFLDSDDYIYSGTIERMYKEMKNQSADMVICGFEKGEGGDFDFSKSLDSDTEIINNVIALSRIYQSGYYALQYVVPWGKLYKKCLFENIQYPEGKLYEDIYVTHQILYKCDKIAVMRERMFYYYQHQNSIMHQKFNFRKLDYLDALRNRIKFYEQKNLNDLAQMAYDEYIHSLIWEYSRVRDILKNQIVLKDIIRRFKEIYVKGYSSKRYPKENRLFLYIFAINPEVIMLYWKISTRLEKFIARKRMS